MLCVCIIVKCPHYTVLILHMSDYCYGNVYIPHIQSAAHHGQSLSIAKNTMITYLSLHLIANKTLELVHENAPEYTIFK